MLQLNEVSACGALMPYSNMHPNTLVIIWNMIDGATRSTAPPFKTGKPRLKAPHTSILLGKPGQGLLFL